jgi:PD-(D/E)XK nuclease family transposase
MLANLDNEVHFKKVFTDVEVFTAFVKDVLGIDIQIDKVETEKVLPSKVSAIRFKMDLFAEDKASRTVVEIQKVDYDYTYDRFSHYFLANLVDVQRKSDDYSFDQEVYVIVVVTSAYKISDITGKPIKKDVLITDINPRDLNGEIIRMTNHKMLILNPTYIQPNTPEDIADWLNLIKESMKNPENPNINTSKPAIVRAAKLAEKEKLTPEQVAEAKIQNMRKKAIAIGEKHAADEVTNKGIQRALKRGKLTIQEIAEDFEVTEDYVRQIENEMKKNK